MSRDWAIRYLAATTLALLWIVASAFAIVVVLDLPRGSGDVFVGFIAGCLFCWAMTR